MRKNLAFLTALFLITFISSPAVYAQEVKEANALTQCIGAAKTGESPCLVALKDKYFKENKYSEFAEALKALSSDNKAVQALLDYYVALTRYSQLKYLEETKAWDEYFAKGNDYREDIVNSSQKAIISSSSKDALNIYSKLLIYQFHKDQQDTFSDAALTDLLSSVPEYAQAAGSDINTIKEIADKLLVYGENSKAKELYKIYTAKLSGPEIKDAQLKAIAEGFYKDGHLELAENIYNSYIQRLLKSGIPKEKLIPELIAIAKDFAYRDNAPCDMLYAEEIFKKIEEIGGEKAFDEKLMYLRGFNLEKAKAFGPAKDIYVNFLKSFPESSYSDQLTYKTGIIFIYMLRDLKAGRGYLETLAQKSVVSSYTLASLYQLGLLKQWEGDSPAAKEYYDLIVAKGQDIDQERLLLAQSRLNEIEQAKPLDYNITISLDTALKEEYANLDMSKINLKASLYLPEKDQELTISSSASLGPSGCLQVELQYLWSGDMGGVKAGINQPEFKTSYKSGGTKLIIMVLVSPEGITERSVDLIDAH